MQTRSLGLALTLFLLTSTFVALDLTDVQTGSAERVTSQASSINAAVNALAIMPSSVAGIAIPKADISDGVFAVGSSTGKEGLDDDGQDAESSSNDVRERTGTPAANADKTSGFVLI